MPNTDYIVVGEFLNVHGIKGWLTIKSYTYPINNIFDYDLFIEASNSFNSIEEFSSVVIRSDLYKLSPRVTGVVFPSRTSMGSQELEE